jgi:hypothetical protein
VAVEAIESEQFAKAARILERIASAGGLERLRQAMAAAAAQPRARSAGSGGAVALAKMRLKWNATRMARDSAIATMKAVASELLETEEYAADPRSAAAKAKIRDIGSGVPQLDAKLGGLLEELAEATDQGQRDALRERIRDSLRLYKAELDAYPLLTELQNTSLGYTPLAETIYNALADLEAALA